MKDFRRNLLNSVALSVAIACAQIAGSGAALANDKLVELSKSEENWPITGKNYNANNYSKATQITAENVKNLRASWTFSTGLLHGHEGTPLVVNGKMYVHTSFPNYTFAFDLKDPANSPDHG